MEEKTEYISFDGVTVIDFEIVDLKGRSSEVLHLCTRELSSR